MTISFDIIQTIAIAVIVLYLGNFIRNKIHFLERFCIPAPVIGGIIFSIIVLIGYMTNYYHFEFDTTLQSVFMTAFFTTIGFSASLKILKEGGIKVFIFLAVVIVLVILQDILGISLAKLFGLNPLIGLSTGSVPMVGGHGTAGAFAPIFEDLGASGAVTVAMASATFGLIAGSMIGGPLGKRLVEKNDLRSTDTERIIIVDSSQEDSSDSKFSQAAYQIIIAMGIGTVISKVLVLITGQTFPEYLGAMFAAAIIRNVTESSSKFEIHIDKIETIGNFCLSMFLAMALMTLKLWELADLALPLLVMLGAQTVLMSLFAYYVTFNIMGKDYDAAVIACGNCGFGMGATPNAMANMQAMTSKFGYSKKAFFIVPLVGSLFIDFVNTTIITIFMNMFS